MSKRVTIGRIASDLGLSISTVSRCLSGNAAQYRIRKETVALVQKKAEELQFTPSPTARSLRLGRSGIIGLQAPDVANIFFAGIAGAVEEVLGEAGYSVLLCDSGEDEEREARGLKSLMRRDVDGLVLCPVGRSAERLDLATRLGLAESPDEDYDRETPVVLVDRYFADSPLPAVAADHRAGARIAVEHLLAKGHRKIAFLCGLAGTTPNEERRLGCLETLREAGVEVPPSYFAGDGFGRENGRRGAEQLLREAPDATAWFAFGNLIAVGALDALRAAGKRVGEEISLICFDDHPLAEHLSPPLSVVAQDNVELGRRAGRLLLDWIGGKPPPPGTRVLLMPRLIERASVAALR